MDHPYPADPELHDNKTDAELVALSLRDQAWYLHLMRRYEDRLKRYILRLSSLSVEDAEEILQDVFFAVYQNLREYDQDLPFSSWIYRITRNQTISRFRHAQARPRVLYSDDDQIVERIASEMNLAEALDRDLLRTKLMKLLEQLDEKYRDVIILRYFEEKEYTEISDIVKKPPGTVATLLNRAKKKLAEIIATTNQSL